MTTKLLAIAMVLASLFGAQQAVAKSSTKTKTTSTTKKKHKKHPKKTAAIRMSYWLPSGSAHEVEHPTA